VGNFLKRKDPQTKLVYGDGKGLKKYEKLQGFKFAYVHCNGLRKYPSKLSENKFRDNQTSRKYKYPGPDLGRGPRGPGPQASHQKGASHQTLQFLFRAHYRVN